MVTDGTIHGGSVPCGPLSYPALYVIGNSDDISVFQVSQYVPVPVWGPVYPPLRSLVLTKLPSFSIVIH